MIAYTPPPHPHCQQAEVHSIPRNRPPCIWRTPLNCPTATLDSVRDRGFGHLGKGVTQKSVPLQSCNGQPGQPDRMALPALTGFDTVFSFKSSSSGAARGHPALWRALGWPYTEGFGFLWHVQAAAPCLLPGTHLMLEARVAFPPAHPPVHHFLFQSSAVPTPNLGIILET